MPELIYQSFTSTRQPVNTCLYAKHNDGGSVHWGDTMVHPNREADGPRAITLVGHGTIWFPNSAAMTVIVNDAHGWRALYDGLSSIDDLRAKMHARGIVETQPVPTHA